MARGPDGQAHRVTDLQAKAAREPLRKDGRTGAVERGQCRATVAADDGEAAVGQERLKRDLEVAREIQNAMLPEGTWSGPGVEAFGLTKPANTVGGDFYDVLPLNDGTWLATVGDICGKGTGAAVLTGVMRSTIRALALHMTDLEPMVRGVNEALLREVIEARLPQAVSLLAKAKLVFVAGFRASFAPAFSFHYQYRLFRPSIALLRGESGTLDMDLRALQKGDVLVLFGFAPYSQEAVLAHQAARQADAQILAICDSLLAPIAQQADATLLFGTDSPSFFPSLVAAQALVEVLLEQVLAKAGSRAVSGIELLENQLHQSGAYWK
mgnify:CR=1 FL=1